MVKRTSKPAPLCRGRKRSGDKCRNRTNHPSGFCKPHRNQRHQQPVAPATVSTDEVDIKQMMQALGSDAVTPASFAAGSLRTAEELARRLLSLADDEGATESPFVTPDGAVESAVTGCCCALESSDGHLPAHDIDPSNPEEMAPALERTTNVVRQWLADMQPLLETGCAWIGMWRDPDTEECEINVTLVIRDREFVEALGRHQNQKSVYDIDAGDTVITGGTGGTPYSPEVGVGALHLPTVEEAQRMRSNS